MRLLLPGLLALSLTAVADAELVDFENAAAFGGDNAVVTNDYFAEYGLSVNAMAGSTAADAKSAVLTFEASGRDGSDAFWSTSSGRDEAYSGSLGDYLLKAGTGDLSYGKSEYFKMSIDYENPTLAASGEVWDIDGPEQYQVTAIDANGTELASIVSPVGGLNAEPWTWSFESGVPISTIDVEFVGAKNLRGFAFDNFNATEANPEAKSHAATDTGGTPTWPHWFRSNDRPKTPATTITVF